ncbi:MAG: hypothetical protein V4634_10890 [Pseudomonadota bacterium]
MSITTISKALILISFLAASSYTVGLYTAAAGAGPSALPVQPVYPSEQPAEHPVQTVIVSAKRLTPAEKARIDEIETLLSTQDAALPKRHARILT